MARVPGAAGRIAGQAERILRRHLVAIAAAVGAVVDLVRPHVIGSHQQAVGKTNAALPPRGRCTRSCRLSRASRWPEQRPDIAQSPWMGYRRCSGGSGSDRSGSPRWSPADARRGFPDKRQYPRSSPVAPAAPRSSIARHTCPCGPVVRHSVRGFRPRIRGAGTGDVNWTAGRSVYEYCWRRNRRLVSSSSQSPNRKALRSWRADSDRPIVHLRGTCRIRPEITVWPLFGRPGEGHAGIDIAVVLLAEAGAHAAESLRPQVAKSKGLASPLRLVEEIEDGVAQAQVEDKIAPPLELVLRVDEVIVLAQLVDRQGAGQAGFLHYIVCEILHMWKT